MPCFVANTKLGTAMIDTIGCSGRVNNILSTLNIKPVHRKSLQAIERRAGAFVESVAVKSTQQAARDAFLKKMEDIANAECAESACSVDLLIEDLGVGLLPDASPSLRKQIESSATVEAKDSTDDSDDTDQPPYHNAEPVPPSKRKNLKSRKKLSSLYPCKTRHGMSCAVDTAWQKRGFDSLTSHTFFMSKARYGKKVVKSLISHRTCRTCKWWRRNRPGQPVRKHRCVRNHTGSARLMESASGVVGIQQLAKEGTPVEYIEGDGDNTLIARLKASLNIAMKKRFDKKHVVKNIGKPPYALQSEKGVKVRRTVINHIQKCISYAFSKNSGDKVGLEENPRAIIPHNFKNHSLCQARFCGYKRKPGEKYIHHSLPYKIPLSGEKLRSALDAIMAPVIGKAEQYSDLGSSQQCEHANREVALRAPKSIHYGDTEALDFRVHATAAFINEGRHYISMVNTEAELSPGEHTLAYADRCAKQRKHSQEISQLPATKRRRLLLKQERAVTQGAQESLEGLSYQSGVGHREEVDIDRLPDAVPKGNFKPVTVSSGSPTYVIMDLETTDLIRGGQMPHITQLAATEIQSGSVFSSYVLPELPMSQEAERVTGITMTGNDSMMVNGKSVKALPWKPAVECFISWLNKFQNVFLVAHNGRRFDFPVLVSACLNVKYFVNLLCNVTGMIDSLPVFRKAYPKMSSYKQEVLARELLNIGYDAHNAEQDVKCLSKLISFLLLANNDIMISNSFSPMSVYHNQCFSKERNKNMPSLVPLVVNSVMKTATAENIAGSGLGLNHLRIIYKRNGEDGLLNTFTAKNSEGLPRVTNCKRTLEMVVPNLVQFFQRE